MIEITCASKDIIKVDEKRQFHGFKGGDIYLNINENSSWFDLICYMAGFDGDDNYWSKPLNTDYDYRFYAKFYCALLERPGMRFKVNECLFLLGFGEVKILMIDPNTEKYYVSNPKMVVVDKSIDFTKAEWCPPDYKTDQPCGKWYSETELLELVEQKKQLPDKEENIEMTEKKTLIKYCESKCGASEWFKQFSLCFKAGIAHLFILWGNVYDFQRNIRGEYVSFRRYLEDVFAQRDMVMFYSLSSGLQFASEEMEKLFRSRFLGTGAVSTGNTTGMSEAEKKAIELKQV
ncbi:MAG: hypothetical protein US83_C0007G0028 [Candidatus Falkowbacteria bacterium GW2011_GWC2_38_22]|uniref:Uncharacterized protein n=1 Tax=Candidatus Falkowbacteria bacterium GW2011_GWE1_38_31 TaxID=1618638 RepID=A0A0G0M8B6_9BACT|nr:MAG: hypothetical protein US73_C0008G0029 [Candidatus Falkowbacteria bacterium GW2011_GWF2_38_1205]KKQ61292.1 MAG: hypothetical protein US83_C0007G0028 [Candidatus Falkowbacteria bacterium GW2011_GWC2_38_22]KKQ63136.1 MAG: hypothetical protein US84_C0008G0029 [Candidatus Falkowbacteria bacterium GW2011_GWF1_38_22]KKQ65333.1 MAG: hypothetical protein US87_C0008G0029 [Candidatus Falkowbacteria bacterium GW2011_GWE2_38_254]KKQ69909.1 MAG: hypothetical protein US91_C0008G0029 [Candidatus Falkowb